MFYIYKWLGETDITVFNIGEDMSPLPLITPIIYSVLYSCNLCIDMYLHICLLALLLKFTIKLLLLLFSPFPCKTSNDVGNLGLMNVRASLIGSIWKLANHQWQTKSNTIPAASQWQNRFHYKMGSCLLNKPWNNLKFQHIP